MSKGLRLDELLVKRGLFSELHDAQAAVLAGEVVVGEHRETSCGKRVPEDTPLRLKAGKEKDRLGFASRGGAKLERALDAFSIDVAGCSCVDLGCSTGGFTDCLLQHGAARVSSVDVGYADFDWRLRNDARVSLHERTNVIGIDVAAVGGPFDIAVADLSFVSLTRVMADIAGLLVDGGQLAALVKPQFEVGKDEVGEGGVVRDTSLHEAALRKVALALPEHGLQLYGITHSPVKGAKGNIEFLIHAVKGDDSQKLPTIDVEQAIIEAVKTAHAALEEDNL